MLNLVKKSTKNHMTNQKKKPTTKNWLGAICQTMNEPKIKCPKCGSDDVETKPNTKNFCWDCYHEFS